MKTRTLAWAALALLVVTMVVACRGEEPESIVVAADRVTVFNRTAGRWTEVDVWLNDHYRVQVRELAAGQRLDVPITVFVAGFGQRFDTKRQSAFGVEVTARDGAGTPVRLTWGKGRRR
ncbi:MAG TPA: hypothetical protein VGK32_11500 [Vicinamibacterales bacterium]|jgi:hypothetical protein